MKKIIILFFSVVLLACGGGDTDPGNPNWVRIDNPSGSYSTSSDVARLDGSAAMGDGSSPDTIYWYANNSSGVVGRNVICLLACIAFWETTIPLAFGENTITVTMMDASDQVTITRYSQVVASGRISMNTATGITLPEIPIDLTGIDINRRIITDGVGEYSFSNLTAGTYTITPGQPSPPQSSTCYSFTPSSREITVPSDNNNDIREQDFFATQVVPCYSIYGRVLERNNLSNGVPDINITLSDQDGNEKVVSTDRYGFYNFYHFEPGTYTLTPSCELSDCNSIYPSFIEVIITDSTVYPQNFLITF